MTVTVDELLTKVVRRDGSDLHLKANQYPMVRVYGDLYPMEEYGKLGGEQVRDLCFSVISPAQRERFERELELDFAYEVPGLSRFRGNIYQQRGNVQAAFRVIPYRIQTVEELHLPSVCRYFAERPRGLVLVTGPAGSGKSTTQAAMLHYINQNFPVHIVTVEDPIEFVHEPKVALVNQRELDTDTHTFANALKFVLRQDPDVILVGEMRDLETIHLAITAAETGHLVFGTLHTPDAVQTVDRVIDVFPLYQQQQIRMQLSVNLVGVISQTLCKRADGKGRVAAFEVLVGTSAVRNLIREAKTFQLTSLIQTGTKQGMMTLDQSLASLVKRSIVTYEEALSKAKDVKEFNALLGLDQSQAPHPSAAASMAGARAMGR